MFDSLKKIIASLLPKHDSPNPESTHRPEEKNSLPKQVPSKLENASLPQEKLFIQRRPSSSVSANTLYNYLVRCTFCGKDFLARKRYASFCSKRCQGAWQEAYRKSRAGLGTPVSLQQKIWRVSPITRANVLKAQKKYKDRMGKEAAIKDLVKQCPVCSILFFPKKPGDIYCSHECYARSRSIPFVVSQTNSGTEKVATNTQYSPAPLPLQDSATSQRKCIICGKPFSPGRKGQVTCGSLKCQRKNMMACTYQKRLGISKEAAVQRVLYPPYKKELRICAVCGKTFVPITSNQKTCSPACQKKNNRADGYSKRYGVSKEDALYYVKNR